MRGVFVVAIYQVLRPNKLAMIVLFAKTTTGGLLDRMVITAWAHTPAARGE